MSKMQLLNNGELDKISGGASAGEKPVTIEERHLEFDQAWDSMSLSADPSLNREDCFSKWQATGFREPACDFLLSFTK